MKSECKWCQGKKKKKEPHTLKSEWISLCITLEWRCTPAAKNRLYFQFTTTDVVTSRPKSRFRFDRALINTTGPDSAGYMHYLWWFRHREASSILSWLWNTALWSSTSSLSLFFFGGLLNFLSVSDLNFKVLLTLKNMYAPMFEFFFFFYRAEQRVCLFSSSPAGAGIWS